MTTPTLKPCPFCGGEAEIVRKGTARQSMEYGCTGCGARLECGDVFGLTNPQSYSWNNRHDTRSIDLPEGGAGDKTLEQIASEEASYYHSAQGPHNPSVKDVILYALRRAKEQGEKFWRDALARSGMTTMQCSNGMFICYKPEVTAQEEENSRKLIRENIDLRAQLRQAEETVANVRQLVKDGCEDETKIKELCRPFTDVDGDTYGVPTHVDVVEAVIQKLHQSEKQREEAVGALDNARLAGWKAGMTRATEIVRTWASKWRGGHFNTNDTCGTINEDIRKERDAQTLAKLKGGVE